MGLAWAKPLHITTKVGRKHPLTADQPVFFVHMYVTLDLDVHTACCGQLHIAIDAKQPSSLPRSVALFSIEHVQW